MKKFCLLIIAMVALATPCNAFGPLVFGGQSAASPTYFCNTCPSSAQGANVLCEDCHTGASTGLCGWTITEAGGDTGDINFAATPDNSPALGCTDLSMTYAITSTKINTTSTALRATRAISPGENTYLSVYIKITAESLADGGSKMLFYLDGDDADAYVYLTQSGGALYFMVAENDGSTSYDTGGTAIDLDTWYGFQLRFYNPSGTGSDSVQWWVDYNLDGTYTNEGTFGSLSFSGGIATIGIGKITDDDIRAATYTLAGLKIDGTSMPSDCSR